MKRCRIFIAHRRDVMTTMLRFFALALLGAMIAGSLGAWRAARLRPTKAMANLG